ncbi:rCG35936, partial [Rattus norvegicus]
MSIGVSEALSLRVEEMRTYESNSSLLLCSKSSSKRAWMSRSHSKVLLENRLLVLL